MIKSEFIYLNCAVLITAAGFSDRMGSHKALLKFNGKLTFLEKLIETYTTFGCNRIAITVNDDLFKSIKHINNQNITFVVNQNPELERLHSIQLGLQVLNQYDFCFLQPIDNPFTELKILKSLYKQRNHNHYLVPSFNEKGGHPILINKKIINHLCTNDLHNQKLKEVLKQFNRKNIQTNNKSILYNINTLEDYQNIIIKNDSN